MNNQRVEVYYNLHKKCLSVRPIGGKVSHTNSILMENVKFSVQPAGRRKVLAEKRKNVHAFVRGNHVDDMDKLRAASESQDWNAVYYNPYKHDTFICLETEEPIYAANECLIIDKYIFVR